MVISPLSDASIIGEEVRFENAFCINMKIKYNRYGTSHYIVYFTISAGKMSVGHMNDWVDNHWTNL